VIRRGALQLAGIENSGSRGQKIDGGGDDAGLPPGDPHNVNQHASEREPEGNDRWQRARAARLNLDEPTNAALAKNTSLVVR
jgi:hypothetical protein